MMRTAYIKLTRYWTTSGGRNTNAEVQLEPRPDEDTIYTNDRMTALQVFSRRTGDSIGGQMVFDPGQLADLHKAIGERLAEIEELARVQENGQSGS